VTPFQQKVISLDTVTTQRRFRFDI